MAELSQVQRGAHAAKCLVTPQIAWMLKYEYSCWTGVFEACSFIRGCPCRERRRVRIT